MRASFTRSTIVGTTLGLLVGLLIGFAIWHSSDRPVVPAASGAQQAVVVQTPASQPAVVLLTGSPEDHYGRTYGCGAGYQTVDVPVGEVISPKQGTQFKLSEKRDGADYQESVTGEATLGEGYELGGAIVVTAANIHAPSLYSQFALNLPLDAQGRAVFTLRTGAYAENYHQEGIALVRFCVHV